jgi:FkbM family methyltransferase
MSIGLLLRSKSFRLAIDRHVRHIDYTELHTFVWNGNPVYYRPGTCDIGIIDELLLKKHTYKLPPNINPLRILDFGGNIGIASVYFASQYPDAEIYTFEPVPDNYAILAQSSAPYNIKTFKIAVGNENKNLTLNFSDNNKNFGGFSAFNKGVNTSNTVEVPCRHAGELMQELNIEWADVIKIDTEGAEYDILTTLPIHLLKNTKVILGELHGNRDFETLAYLEPYFDIEVYRAINQRVFIFKAINHNL